MMVMIMMCHQVQVYAFQQPLQTAFRKHQPSKSTSSTPISSSSSTSSPTALNVKFRLDNDDDDQYEYEFKTSTQKQTQQRDQPSTKSTNNEQQQQQQQQYEFEAPQTTFGAEAVPEAQRPANEYMELLTSPLFDWANRTPNGDSELALRLSVLYAVLFGLVCWPISGATFTVRGYELHQFFSSNIGALGFVLMLVLRLYTGWGYVGSRLQSKEIEYEETGW